MSQCLREGRGHHENGAPTHQQREDGKTRADPQLLTYYGHRQPGLVETAVIPSQALEPWSPEQPDGQGDATPPPVSCLSTALSVLRDDRSRLGGTASPVLAQGFKASPYHLMPRLAGSPVGTGRLGYAGPSWSSQRRSSRPVVCTRPSGRSRLDGEGDGRWEAPSRHAPLNAGQVAGGGPYAPSWRGEGASKAWPGLVDDDGSP